MRSKCKSPILVKNLPQLIITEGERSSIDLKEFVKSPAESGNLHFSVRKIDGTELPTGLICTKTGLFSGIAASGIAGNYNLMFIVKNDSLIPLLIRASLIIYKNIYLNRDVFLDIRYQIWGALGEYHPILEMDLLSLPLNAEKTSDLFDRYAILRAYDIYNIDGPSEKRLLSLADNSPYFNIYDRGSCLVAVPKDFHDEKRTFEDTLQASYALAREVYKRGWSIEFVGDGKMVGAAWAELMMLGYKGDILHFSPTEDDISLYLKKVLMKWLLAC